MNKPIHFSIALIRRMESEITRWLVIENPAANQWEFIFAQRLEKEVGSQTLAREIGWRLNLDRKTDFLIGKMAMLNVEIDKHEFDSHKIQLHDSLDDENNIGDDPADATYTDESMADSDKNETGIVKIEFVPVEVYRRNVLADLEQRDNVCWVSSAEVCDGKFTRDELRNPNSDSSGETQKIDPVFAEWNRKWKIIQPWVI